MLCSVTPEEYRSMLLIANSWTTATIRYGTTNQPGKTATSPLTEMMPNAAAEPATAVATAAPRTSRRTEGMPAPNATASTTLRFRLSGGKVPRIVVGVLRPAQPSGRDNQRHRDQDRAPPRAVPHPGAADLAPRDHRHDHKQCDPPHRHP